MHHNDLDGRCAADVVRKGIQQKHPYAEVYFHECAYKDDFGDFEFVNEDTDVVVVDFGFQKDGDWDKLIAKAKSVTWIDHHKTAIEKDGPQKELPGKRELGRKAGCMLAWEYYFPGEQSPEAVDYTSDYDTWTFKYGNRTKAFQAGMLTYDTSPDAPVWIELINGVNANAAVEEVVAKGRAILEYRDVDNAEYLKSFAYPVAFEGHNALVCNKGKTNSMLFDSADDAYDLWLTCVHDGKVWTVSLYTPRDDLDVSVIAKKYGGGGHPKASGFQCEELPWTRKS
jgi:oligoribonuclease NrnB/cAMP/cGMP phosphodiesterase (DHH superfamily)